MMEDDRGELERRLKQLGNALTLGIVTSYGERDEARRMLFEAADTIGAARRAMEMALRHVAGTTPMVDSGSEFGPVADECDRVRKVLREALAKLEGGG